MGEKLVMDKKPGFLRLRQAQSVKHAPSAHEVLDISSEDHERRKEPVHRAISESKPEKLPTSEEAQGPPGEPGLSTFASFKFSKSLLVDRSDGLDSTLSPRFWLKRISSSVKAREVTDDERRLVLQEAGTVFSSDLILDPLKKVQWFGSWRPGELLNGHTVAPKWSGDDLAVFPALAGKVPMLAFMDHSLFAFLVGFMLCACGAGFFSLLAWAAGDWFTFGVAIFLGARALVLLAHALVVWLSMEGTEAALAMSYPWLDGCTMFAIVVLHIQHISSLHVCIGAWLIARGAWLEAMSLASNWSEVGREWWLALLAVWPPVLVGGFMVAGLPSVDLWYIAAVTGVCCIIDGLPLWISSASVRVHMLQGDGWTPQYAREFVRESLGHGCFVHGILRMSLLALFAAAYYVSS